MLIRSQDKETLVNFNNSIVINAMDIEGIFKIVCSYSCDDYIIGRYSSKAKAMKVLDMLQECYEEYEIERIYRSAIFNIDTFQMPDDSEVEV